MTCDQRGLTIAELLVGLVLLLLLTMTVLPVTASLSRASVAQPQSADQQQRLRGVIEQVSELVVRAGEGLGGDEASGHALLIPPLYPQRRGVTGADPDTSAFADRLTVVRLAESSAEARLAVPMAGPTWPIPVDEGACAPGRVVCGFQVGGTALLADARTNGEWFTVASVAAGAIGHTPAALTATYAPSDGARLVEVEVRAVFFDTRRRQLRLLGPGMNLALIDGIAGFEVAWLGDPRPPRGPTPPTGLSSCLVDVAGAPRLPMLAATDGPWTTLSEGDLTDGPWCGREPWRFDADLYRVRMLALRVILAAPTVRSGPVPAGPPADIEIVLAPPNLRRMS